jgi:hypothetical protein
VRNGHRILVGKPERKRPLERPRDRQENNDKVYPEEIVLKIWTKFIYLKMRTSSGLLLSMGRNCWVQ